MEIRDLLVQPRSILEGVCERRAFYAYLGDGLALCRVLGKYLMYVDPRDIALAPHLISSGYWEAWITQALLRLPVEANCADVGANVGYYTLLLADLCGGRVHAFEPQDELAEMLRASARINGFRDVVVTTAAVGEERGWTRIVESTRDRGGVQCLPPEDLVSSSIPIVALDDAVKEPLDFIKMDCEGYEPRVWAGMKRHLENRPTILMEFTPAAYEDASGFLAEISSCYTLREVDNNGSVVSVKAEQILERESFSMLWLEA